MRKPIMLCLAVAFALTGCEGERRKRHLADASARCKALIALARTASDSALILVVAPDYTKLTTCAEVLEAP